MKIEIWSDVVCPGAYGIPGAQPAEVFLRALQTAYAEERRLNHRV